MLQMSVQGLYCRNQYRKESTLFSFKAPSPT